MQDILLGYSHESRIVDAVMTVESLVLGIDECSPEDGVHLFVGDGCAVLAEELADLLAVGTIDDRGGGRTLVLDGRHRGRLAEEPQEIDVYGSQIEEECHDERGEGHGDLDVPGATLIEAFIPRPDAFYCLQDFLPHIYLIIVSVSSGWNQRMLSSFLNQVSCLRA